MFDIKGIATKNTTLLICSDTERKWVLWCVETCIIQDSNFYIEMNHLTTNILSITTQIIGVEDKNCTVLKQRKGEC